MSAPAVSSMGSWVGGLWPDYATWHDEWCFAWAMIGQAVVIGHLLRLRHADG